MTAYPEDSPETGATRVARAWFELLSSMRFAISLLTVICIASVIGTVLKQQEPLVNYVNQFGPFWATVFGKLGLYAVYSAWWFLLILGFLVLSTSLCIIRNTPKILADLRAYKENIREQALQAFHHRAQGAVDEAPEVAARRLGGVLAVGGWKVKLQQRETSSGPGWMVAAKAGAANKLGYLAAHSAIVLICIGGLLDGDLIVRAQMWMGGKTPYAGGGLIADVKPEHRLDVRNPTFRGNLLVAEGTQSNMAILNQSDGILLQELPFSIELQRFIVEYYETGMPKLFASEIVIHDRAKGTSLPARVEVNHPVSYAGVEIYQSSFDDGGSTVRLRGQPLNGVGKPLDVEGTIGSSTRLSRGSEELTLEYTGLRVINVENFAGKGGAEGATDVRKVDLHTALDQRLGAANKTETKKTLRNVGPSVSYKLRDAAGQAREFNNYMLPMDLGDGVPVFLFGMRDRPDEAYRYLRVPADSQGSTAEFYRLRAALGDAALRAQAVRRYAAHIVDPKRKDLLPQLESSALRAMNLFAGVETVRGSNVPGGLQAVADFMDNNVPEAERSRAGEMLVRILNGSLFELLQLSRERAGLKPLATDEATQGYMSLMVLAQSDAYFYPVPMVLQLADFKHLQASVFQVARAPGKNVVYFGCALLILGVFAMLYVRERRLWIWVTPQGTQESGSQVQMALSSNRQTLDVDREFENLRSTLLPRKES
jgi:cytochrome c biogenesis protein